MSEATVIYPHQLFKASPTLSQTRPVYLVEEPLLLTHNPIHRQKLIFHKLSLDAYQAHLEEEGYRVTRLTLEEHCTTEAIFARLAADGITQMHIVDTTDDYLEQAIKKTDIERIWYDSPLFILTKEDATDRYQKSGRFMAKFYKQLRIDKKILTEKDDAPTGGKWSFDDENRKKIPKDVSLPDDISCNEDSIIKDAAAWAEHVEAERYGEAGCWLPYTHEAAEAYLNDFLVNRLACFGDYEDAITTEGIRLWHSTLSPLLNVGLLTPAQVLESALTYAKKHQTPLNSLEGFVRQIIGWREFIRAAYECDGRSMRSKNFWKHEQTLPEGIWDATTGILPLDQTIERAYAFGYNHHIERLMIMGNFMLLTQTNPDEVYRWFMGMYVDAYDWVMVPNVYGMSQFADGGSFATKPYISGSNYLRKMSNLPKGDWEDVWTALYWHFIATHFDFFKRNHRLSMMPRMLEKMDAQKKQHYRKTAAAFLKKSE